jgi:hypothetical protein
MQTAAMFSVLIVEVEAVDVHLPPLICLGNSNGRFSRWVTSQYHIELRHVL